MRAFAVLTSGHGSSYRYGGSNPAVPTRLLDREAAFAQADEWVGHADTIGGRALVEDVWTGELYEPCGALAESGRRITDPRAAIGVPPWAPDAPARRMFFLAQEAAGCSGCRLATLVRSQVVWGVGPVPAQIMLVGQNPGEVENDTGEPFTGDAGSYLDDGLVRAGLAREDVYIANVGKCWTPDNRAPHPDEVDACTSRWLVRQIELVSPIILVAVGTVASRFLTGKSVMAAHGVVHAWRGIPVYVTFHPSGLNEALRVHLAKDLRKVRRALQSLSPVLLSGATP